MAKTVSSKRWLQEHFNDFYVQQAQKDGFRGRAAYKLIELQEKDKIIKQGNIVLDLGAAPGSWSQVVRKILNESGKIIASDILTMDVLEDVHFIQGDFTTNKTFNEILEVVNQTSKNGKIDVVLSDMAPNMSGIKSADQIAAMYLCELALDIASRTLSKNGSFVVKLFQGAGSDEFIKEVRNIFKQVNVRKPKASRPRSTEVYVIAKHLKQLF